MILFYLSENANLDDYLKDKEVIDHDLMEE